MKRRWLEAFVAVAALAVAVPSLVRAQHVGIPVDRARYTNRQLLPDFTASDCPFNPRSLVQLRLTMENEGAASARHTHDRPHHSARSPQLGGFDHDRN
jgi:hypothetical protein